ncbi:MAG: 50S ribosomal protein L29 [Candidatus Shapirobacteria bacterium]|nr:50S ribosomal protein L29 [Candidatus Shapirobacteria bacterium]
MKKTAKIAYSEKSLAELQKLLAESGKKLVETRTKLITGNLKDTSVFKKIKYEIAYISTLIKKNG